MPTHKTCSVCARKFVVFGESKYSRAGYCGKTCSLSDRGNRRKKQNRAGNAKRKRAKPTGKPDNPQAWELDGDGLELFAALKRAAANEPSEADEVLLMVYAQLVRARRDWRGIQRYGDTTGAKDGGLKEFATARAAGRVVYRNVG